MKSYGGVDIYIHIFLTSALVGCETYINKDTGLVSNMKRRENNRDGFKHDEERKTPKRKIEMKMEQVSDCRWGFD
jgi:hypothetical protein